MAYPFKLGMHMVLGEGHGPFHKIFDLHILYKMACFNVFCTKFCIYVAYTKLFQVYMLLYHIVL